MHFSYSDGYEALNSEITGQVLDLWKLQPKLSVSFSIRKSQKSHGASLDCRMGGWNHGRFAHLGRIHVLKDTMRPARSPSRGGDVTVYVLDIIQLGLPTLFLLFLCLFLSLWPFQLYFIPRILPTTLCFLFRFFWSYFCLNCPFNYIFLFMKVFLSPNIILCGWLGLKN